METHKLVIDRSKWFRGKGSYDSRLVRYNGQMCCLGFLGKACGVHAYDLNNQLLPSPPLLYAPPGKWPSWLFDAYRGKEHRFTLAEINDDANYTDEMREAMIIRIFGEHGWEVTFIDGATP